MSETESNESTEKKRSIAASSKSTSALSNLLPVDKEAEMALLGSILVSGSYSHEILDEIGEKLKPEYFSEPKHQKIYNSILHLWSNQLPIDSIHLLNTIEKKFPDEKKYIDQDFLVGLIAKSSLLSNPVDTVILIREKYILRSIIGLGEEMKLLGFNPTKGPNEILEHAQKKLFEMSIGNVDKNFVRISEILHSSYEKMLDLDAQSSKSVATGFVDLDKMLGGLKNSEMVIIACRPSMGKTAFSLDVAKKVALQGIGVAYFSLEMGMDQICERLIASTSRVDFHRIKSGDLSSDERNIEYEKIATAVGVLGEMPIWIDDSSAASILEIRSKARRLKQRNNIGLIIIDYLQLMSGGNDKAYIGNRVQEVADISRNLKILAKELNVPIIALSQLSRKVESRDDKRPVLSDLRESGSIEQDADVVMFIHREDYYNTQLPEDKRGRAELIIAKNRNGETGKVEVAWIRHLASFDNLYQSHSTHRIEK